MSFALFYESLCKEQTQDLLIIFIHFLSLSFIATASPQLATNLLCQWIKVGANVGVLSLQWSLFMSLALFYESLCKEQTQDLLIILIYFLSLLCLATTSPQLATNLRSQFIEVGANIGYSLSSIQALGITFL
jgi:hypothetical protein